MDTSTHALGEAGSLSYSELMDDVELTVHKQTEYRLMSDELYEDKLAEARAVQAYFDQVGDSLTRWLFEVSP